MFDFNIWVISFLSILFLVLVIFFYFPWLYGAPFDPTSKKKMAKMIRLTKIKKGDTAVDLGSGDGRLVIEMAKKGAIAHGYEINPILVWLSRRKINAEGLGDKAFIHLKSFWKISLKKYNVVTIFQFGHIMKRLEKKLRRELKKGSRVVSNHWKFPNWKPADKSGDILLYKK